MPQILDLCRLCSQKKKIKINLNEQLIQKIESCLSLKVTMEDPLPKSICFDCQRHLDILNSFRAKCHRAEARLLKIANSRLKIKEEIPDESVNYVNEEQAGLLHEDLKSECLEEVIEDVTNSDADFIRILSKEIAQEPYFADTKKPPVIEMVVVDPQLEEYSFFGKTQNNVPPKVEAECLSAEYKPDVIDGKPFYQSDGDASSIPEKYFVLQDGETCDLDIEEMDAVIRKKKDPSCRFQCHICFKTFKFFKMMKKHRKDCDKGISVRCNYCPEKRFISKASLKCHIKNLHLQLENFSCDLCLKKFRTKTERKIHLKIAHGLERVQCRICAETFANRDDLKGHFLSHVESRPHACPKCNRRFRFKSLLKSHLDGHEKMFLCSECGKRFSSKKVLLDHANLHSGSKPYVCRICFVSFAQAASLNQHRGIHKNDRPFCELCRKYFSTARLYKQHIRLHTNDRPFKCDVCSQAFRSQSDLCNHTKIHGEKRFSCKLCDMRFTRKTQLNQHVLRHTGGRHVCPAPNCGKTYSQRYPLSKHFAKTHPELKLLDRPGGRKRKSFLFKEEEPFGDLHYSFQFKEASVLSFYISLP